MKRIKLITLSIVFAILLCGCENSNNNYIPPETLPETTTEAIPVVEITDTDEEETTINDEPEYKEITGTVIAGYLEFEGAESYYTYIAPISGVYRFDFDINNVNYNYRFILTGLRDEEICNETYDCYRNGATCTLEKNQKYKITIQQVLDNPEYTIKIGVPNEVTTINGNEFSGELSFNDKNDEYIYTPNVSGVFRFDFDISNVNNNYQFMIIGEKKEEIALAYYDRSGVNCQLIAGKNYHIHITQIDGNPSYKISIGIPKEIKQINDGVYIGNIKYIGQIDRYTTHFKSGKYFISFSDINADSEIRVTIESSNKTKTLVATPTDEPIAFEIKTDDTYKIYIEYVQEFTNYKIDIYQ